MNGDDQLPFFEYSTTQHSKCLRAEIDQSAVEILPELAQNLQAIVISNGVLLAMIVALKRMAMPTDETMLSLERENDLTKV